jgi:hypothetical protein
MNIGQAVGVTLIRSKKQVLHFNCPPIDRGRGVKDEIVGM